MHRTAADPFFLTAGLLLSSLSFASAFSSEILPGRFYAKNPRRSIFTKSLSKGSRLFATSFDGRRNIPVLGALNGVCRGCTTLSSRLDTVNAAGLSKNKKAGRKRQTILQSSMGLAGHSGLLLASTILVLLAKAFWKTVQQSRNIQNDPEEAISSGPMDRCPWPFIFSHDPVQGIKDPPTWILITWYALWRIVKASRLKV